MNETPHDPGLELAERMSRVLDIYVKREGPRWRWAVDALQSLKGQTLTGLPPRLGDHLESCLLEVNEITAAYPIETFEDYRMITDEELDRIQGRLQAIAFEYQP